jgi:hypothetical protein
MRRDACDRREDYVVCLLVLILTILNASASWWLWDRAHADVSTAPEPRRCYFASLRGGGAAVDWCEPEARR